MSGIAVRRVTGGNPRFRRRTGASRQKLGARGTEAVVDMIRRSARADDAGSGKDEFNARIDIVAVKIHLVGLGDQRLAVAQRQFEAVPSLWQVARESAVRRRGRAVTLAGRGIHDLDRPAAKRRRPLGAADGSGDRPARNVWLRSRVEDGRILPACPDEQQNGEPQCQPQG